MRKSGVISVIVPIYRVEKHLEECIESIIGQTYTNLEIILVDDGSPDRCGAICDRYAQTDNRITVVHQKNSGAAAARNAGLRIASGEYITFVDGDDYPETDAYEKMMRALICCNADIVHGNFRYVYKNGTEVHNCDNEMVAFSTTEYLTQFTTDWTCALAPVKLFRHPVLNDIDYDEGHLIDDELFTYLGVMNAGKIVCIPEIVYNYRQRASSVMKNPGTMDRKCDDILEYLKKRCQDVSTHFPELKSLYEAHYADYLLWLAGRNMASDQTIKKIKKNLIRYVAAGKVMFWKDGQRKRSLNILTFLAKPAGMQKRQKDEVTDHGYQLFE